MDDKRLAVFERGHQVGDMARGLFPGGTDASPGNFKKTDDWIRRTQELIASGEKVIYEAAFIHDGVMAAVDILVRRDGAWQAYEVKSSARISPVYVQDAALQYFVLSGSLTLSSFSLVHLNTTYILEDSLDLRELFTVVPVTDEVLDRQSYIQKKVSELSEVLIGKKTPEVEIGEHCHHPYPCDFMSHCRKHLPASGTIFDLGGISMSTLYEWYHAGKLKLEQLGAEELSTRDLQIQASGTLHVEQEPLNDFLGKLKYPLMFLDFETFMPAIPVFKGTHPYEQIPFQFSAHILDEHGKLSHTDFVSDPGTDPRRKFTEALVQCIAGTGTILAYNATFERMIMKQCAAAFPEFAEPLQEAMGRMMDLMEPFKKKWYYHPNMKGSASIKLVLPALVPELSYEGLKINNGASAMSAYENLEKNMDLFSRHETIDALREYCRLDTLAMVKLLEVLEKAVKD